MSTASYDSSVSNASLKRLLDSIGVAWRQSSSESEALLAEMNANGVIDAIISGDRSTSARSGPLSNDRTRGMTGTEGQTDR